jgi:hypothetical protein
MRTFLLLCRTCSTSCVSRLGTRATWPRGIVLLCTKMRTSSAPRRWPRSRDINACALNAKAALCVCC